MFCKMPRWQKIYFGTIVRDLDIVDANVMVYCLDIVINCLFSVIVCAWFVSSLPREFHDIFVFPTLVKARDRPLTL